MDKNTQMYQDLFKLYSLANSSKPPRVEMAKLKDKLKRKETGGIHSFLKRKKQSQEKHPPLVAPNLEETIAIEDHTANDEHIDSDAEEDTLKPEQSKPAQDQIKEEIAKVDKVLCNLIESRNLGLQEVGSASFLSKQIKDTKKKKDDLEKELRRKISNQRASQKARIRRKEELVKLKENFPEIASSLKVGDNVGRPRIESDQPGLLEDILQIATIGAACADKRRDDIFRTVKTVDDLHREITKLGYSLSRSALYLRLLPRDLTTQEGKKHVVTVPVRLVRPQNNLRKGHPDRIFAAETFKGVDQISEFIGPQAVLYGSQDDKSSVPLGVIAAKKQSSILMSLRCRVRLPDHDFKVGAKHLLTPSVISICIIDPKIGVTYSGPTYVGIRSAKHNGSTAFSGCNALGCK